MKLISCEDRRARKLHRCDFCGLNIDKGELYRHSFQVYDGRAYAWKSHDFCHRFASDRGLYAEFQEEGVTEDTWRTEMFEWLVALLGPEEGLLTSQARAEARQSAWDERKA